MKLLQITKMNYKRSKETSKKKSEYYIGIGLLLGVAFSAAFDNIGLGICLGLVFGVAVQKKNSNN